MPPKGTRKVIEVDSASEGANGPFVASNGAKGNRNDNKKRKRLARLEEYEEDEGRESSRQFTKWAKFMNENNQAERQKSRDFMKTFQVKVKEQEDHLRAFTAQEKAKLDEAQETSGKVLEKLYAIARPPSGKEKHELFKESQMIVARSTALITQFKAADEQLSNCKLVLPVDRWKQDKKEIRELFEHGRQHAVTLAEGMLVPGLQGKATPDKGHMSENEKMAFDLVQGSRKTLGKRSWGMAVEEHIGKITPMARMGMTADPKHERS
ncbi:hypothetical protein F4780DRAFT_229131 [Xylariomycetidae sp. FL0641]|nr:hypothetical protein F4780DRAFT_229131 [Xylariomycetidae sp. FL0641]